MNQREREAEEAGIQLVMPLLETWKKPGTAIGDTKKALNRVVWQRTIGDLFLTNRKDQFLGIEVKTEYRYTGNLFIETWSNYAPGQWQRSGWIFTLCADWIFFVFLERHLTFLANLPRLKKWCLDEGNLYRFSERMPQREQTNRTIGCPVPLAVLWEPVGLRGWSLGDGEKELRLSDLPRSVARTG